MRKPLLKATLACALQAALWAGLPSTASAVPIRFDYTGGFTSYTVVTTGVYQIFAFGAQGGMDVGSNAGGMGAEAAGDFTLTAGQVLNMAVGGMGQSGIALSGGGGGGGGTFLSIAGTLLLVAGGGGGGGGVNNNAADGQAGMSGASGNVFYGPALYAGAGGTAGRGGAGSSDPTGIGGAGGGGVLTNGGNSNNGSGSSTGGASLANGLAGGSGSPYGNGGFGGGGGGNFEGGSGGGGGGYSGGGGGGILGSGGGGGSFDAALTNPDRILASGVNQGNGFLTIELLPAAVTPVPEPSSWTLLGAGLLAVGAITRRRSRIAS